MASLAVVTSCSGNGHFDTATGTCVCNEGWTSFGDFQPVHGHDCGINIESVLALAIVSLILGIIAMVVFCVFLYQNLRKSWALDLKMRFAITYLVQTVACNVYDIAQIVDPDNALYGGTIYITILMALAYATAYGGCVVFFEAVLKLLRGIGKVTNADAQGRMRQSVGLFVSRTRYLYALCGVTGLVSLVSLVVPPEKCHIVARTVFSLWNVFHIAFAYAFNPPMTLIRKEIGEFIEKMSAESISFDTATQFESVRRNMRLAQICINALFVVTFCVYLAFCVSDLLISRTIYVILYCTIGVHVLSVPMLVALTMKSSVGGSSTSISRVARIAGTGTGKDSGGGGSGSEQEKSSLRIKPAYTTVHSSYYERVLPGDSIAEDDVEAVGGIISVSTTALTATATATSSSTAPTGGDLEQTA